ncbi:MAG: DUF2309 domain-containing protein [Rickettsiaceae bacterium]|jgi:uncharacterized protein YbcC (UPF0753/DUF2309 family)|nr:DUF2309 domain-containing protein [Rickettsiaceae bacterium]
MSVSLQYKKMPKMVQEDVIMHDLAKKSFNKIAPFWPLQNLIAVNPLQGFEGLPIEDALKLGSAYFEKSYLPNEMLSVNTETIKWLGVYFDEGQATITMPLRENGLYEAWRLLALYDEKLHKNVKEKIEFLQNLPIIPEQAISECLTKLNIAESEKQEFLTLLLTTLPGWASYIKYKTEWSVQNSNSYNVTQLEYLAVRIVITTLIWPDAKILLHLHKKALENSDVKILEKIEAGEASYRIPLLRKIAEQKIQTPYIPEAQLVFCIDVRSEPFRKALESTGDYQTFGFAGFFGIPVQITDKITDVSYPSCPVLLKPKHEVFESARSYDEGLKYKSNEGLIRSVKKLYQSLKYNFTTPFALVEALGGFSGIWMGARTISPKLTCKINSIVDQTINIKQRMEPSIECMSLQEKYTYAENALRMMGLTHSFAPIIVFCGHGSSTQNNAYATALDCGACGGRHGGSNAKILAAIMNCPEVKIQLSRNGIKIPSSTKFFAAEHNTTTDEVVLFCKDETEEIKKLKHDLEKARSINTVFRLKKLGVKNCKVDSANIRSNDWAQVRPEWGLARNAAFIIGPRDLTCSLELDGRCFLHSYDYKQDPQASFLETILTAPMLVAQWINMQYLFSTINNIAYGGGSKITKNITGKIGIMQGNASDLMNGLPLQSLYKSDTDPYHEPQRLFVVVLAPQIMLDKIIQAQPILQKLFSNGWVQVARIEPENNKTYLLNRGFSWQEVS